MQSIADQNEQSAAAAAGEVYITKDDAAEEQSYETMMFGGVQKGSLAAQMQVGTFTLVYMGCRMLIDPFPRPQSSADKLQYARRRQSD